LHGYAHAKDKPVLSRADLSRSRAMELVLQQALETADKATADLAYFDLYSCFPCAVLLAAEAIGLDWRLTTPTVTGGLPFFGGAGNNYSMHAIARMVELLRADPGTFGLVLANGGYLSKEAAGIYSSVIPEKWTPISSSKIQSIIDSEPSPNLLLEDAVLPIESFGILYRGGMPHSGYVIGRDESRRMLASSSSEHIPDLAALVAANPFGREVAVKSINGLNFFEPDCGS
jgi:acetyl-CoA C-acetyltransferase